MTYPTYSQRDRQTFGTPCASRIRPRHLPWLILGIVALTALVSVLFSSPDAAAQRTALQATQPQDLALDLAIPATPPGVTAQAQPAADLTQFDAAALETDSAAATTQVAKAATALEVQATETNPAAGQWSQATVQRGDSLARIFSRAGIAAGDLHELMSLGAAVNTLKRIHPGQTMHFRTDAGRLLELRYEESLTLGLSVTRDTDDSFVATTIHRIPDRQNAHASATIESSLFMAGQKAKLSDSLIMDLAGIFGWDIDFALDIREGDRFTVLYDELYLDGERIGEGNILAAEFVNQGQVFRAIRYTDSDGRTDYYTPEGRSMRKVFLRTPVEFSRISSGFNLKRKHPVLNRIRAHKGVDYAAPTGTPIKVTGDGRVTYRGVKGGYGNVVIVQHGSAYSTLYAHMSRFAKGVNVGTRVRQGQTIGYIGMSGLATGPHLHYEFLVNGVHRNPLTVKFPDASPIDKRFQADFNKTAQELLAKLDLVRDRTTQVALNNQ